MDHVLSIPQPLAEMVDYDPDSVTSRVIFREPGGTMTVFAFASGQGLPEHTNPNHAIVQVLEGSVSVRVADETHHVEAGQIVHLPPTVPHALLPGSAFKMLLTLVKAARPEDA